MKKKGRRLSNIFLLVSLLTGCAFGFLLQPVSINAAEKKEHIYGLVVGGYPDTKNDCELVYDRLKYNNKTSYIKRYDYDSEKVYSTSAETFDHKIKTSMSGASKKDTYVFYYSGHSLASGNKVSDVEGLNLYLATVNGKEVFASYSWKRLANQLSKFPGKVVVMLDMCHAELFYTEGVSKLTSGKGKFYCIFGSSVDTQSIQGNYFVPSEKRLIYEKKSYGIFTKLMGEGLGYWKGNQRADSNQNGKVSIRELYNYIYQRVQKIKKTNVLYSFEKPTLRLPNGDMELFSYKLSISKTSVSLKKGKHVTLTALSGGKKANAVWKSSNTKVATVKNGKITGKKQVLQRLQQKQMEKQQLVK